MWSAGNPGAESGGITIAGVEPGDSIELESGPVEYREWDVEVQLPGEVAGAERYELDHGCISEAISNPHELFAIKVSQECSGDPATYAVLALAYDKNDDPFRFSFETGTLSATTSTVAVRLRPWSVNQYDPISVEVHDAPETSLGVEVRAETHLSGYPLGVSRRQSINGGESRSFSLRPPDVGSGSAIGVYVEFADGISGIAERRDLQQQEYSFDLRMDILPKATLHELTWPGAHRPLIAWTVAPEPAADLAFLTLVSDGMEGIVWNIVVPQSRMAQQSSFLVPELPEEFAAARPRQELPYFRQMIVLDSNLVTNYRQALARHTRRLLQSIGPNQNERMRLSLTFRGD